MHELYKLKEMLCKELEEYGSKGELSGGTLEVVDKLAHAVKNLDRIIEAKEMEEEGSYAQGGNQGGNYSREYRYSREGGRGGRGGSYRGGSYARGRQNARRDSMGRYSREGYSRGGDNEEYVEQLQDLMQELPPEAQQHVQKAIDKLEQM